MGPLLYMKMWVIDLGNNDIEITFVYLLDESIKEGWLCRL